MSVIAFQKPESEELDLTAMSREELENLFARLEEDLEELDAREPKSMKSKKFEEWAEEHEELEDLMDEVRELLEEMGG